MKTYKINNVEVSEEEIRKIVRENPDLLKETGDVPFMPKPHNKLYFKQPANKSGYQGYLLLSDSTLVDITMNNTEVYRTEEEAKKAVEVDRAILRVRCWIRDNIEGGVWDKPNWSADMLSKYFIRFNHQTRSLETDRCTVNQTISQIGFLWTIPDAQACISACEADLKIIFGIE